MKYLRWIPWTGLIVVVGLIASHPADTQHWLAVHLGLDYAGPDKWYNFWSGFAGDVTAVTLITGSIAFLRHKNCHQKGCWRTGHKVEGTPYLACHKHHPHHEGESRNVHDLKTAIVRNKVEAGSL